MDLRMLGQLEVRGTGGPLVLGGVKQRAVLAMLALRLDEVVSTDLLVDGLWDEAPASALNIVQGYISRLRRALQAEDGIVSADAAVLQRSGRGYLLALEPEHVDLHRFQRLAREGSEALRPAPSRAAGTLREALGLWRGRPMAELADTPFARAEIPRLEQQRLAALEARLEADLALGRHAQLIGELQTLLAGHPLHEGLHRQLMLSLYRSGRQAEALGAYRRAREILSEELGIDPGRTLRELEHAILTQDPCLDWIPPAEPVPQGSAEAPRPLVDPRQRRWNVPARNPHFTGRDDMLIELRRRLHAQEPTLIVQALYGLGGVGKTQLAIEYAHRFAADYDLVWWIDAQQPVLVPDQLVRLADKLGLATTRPVADTVDLVLAELARRDRWLLVFDNAERPGDIAGLRPIGAGHVLVTSRSPGWGALGGRLEVDVLTRAETIELLQARLPTLDEELADELAAELGDLPLAATQAAAYLEQTDLPPLDYLRRFRTRRADLLTRGEVLGYSGRVDTTWTLSLDRLRGEDPAAVQLLELAALLAPDPIPLSLVANRTELLDEPLRTAATDPDSVADAVGELVGYSLARRHPHGFQVHRLVQAVIRNRLPPDRQQDLVSQVMALLAAAHPGDPENSVSWVDYALLTPHVLATAPQADHIPAARQLILDTARYLHAKGDSHGSRAVSEHVLDRWRAVHGLDHADTLTAATSLTLALFEVGELELARALGEDTLQRCLQRLGPNHTTTLWAAPTLTGALDQLGAAAEVRALGEDTLQRSRRVLGCDDAITLWAAITFTGTLNMLGEAEPARALGEDTLQRCRRVLGPDHATTLWAATLFTGALNLQRASEEARSLGEDTLQRCREVLGCDHATTLWAAAFLAGALVRLGELEEARALGEDTLQRCRRVLGPNRANTLMAATALTAALSRLGEVEEASALGEDTLQRCRTTLGGEHTITCTAARILDTCRRSAASTNTDSTDHQLRSASDP
jgi:DNA-binding SARP family transcriptional activator